MQAIVCEALGGVENLALRHLPEPEPGPGEVLVAMHAAALNFPDSLTIAALANGCVFTQIYGAAGAIVEGLATPDGSGVKPFCARQ